MIIKQPSCTDLYETDLLPVSQAIQRIFAALPQINDYEVINIEKSKNRTLYESITAPFNVPLHTNSAVDGYAFNSQTTPRNTTLSLHIMGTAYAGQPFQTTLQPSQCVRIMTGACIPSGADTVIMQEHVQQHGNVITLANQQQPGQNIRISGEDIQQGEIILSAGKQLTPADIVLIASLGIAEIKVKRRLKIAIASTGNEIISIGSEQQTGMLYDSNRYSLFAALDRPDIEIINLGILADEPNTLLTCFKHASQFADVIISSGGVSVGDADHTKTALSRSGQVEFWKLAIKPGRPLAFGNINRSVFFGLPGNPVAVLVLFYIIVQPALDHILGIQNKLTPPTLQAKTTETLRKKPGRTEIVRALLQQDESGHYTVTSTGKQGSGILRSMSLANAFIILEHERTTVQIGEIVTVYPFSGLI